MSDKRKVALYCRVAREDDNAIENQKQALTVYAEKNGLNDLVLYADKGASGISFDRPAFLHLLNDIEAGTVDTVLVYNFSRFSRNAVDTGRFIDGVFPKYGVRFVSVLDGYDSADYENMKDYLTSASPIRVILDLYKQFAKKT